MNPRLDIFSCSGVSGLQVLEASAVPQKTAENRSSGKQVAWLCMTRMCMLCSTKHMPMRCMLQFVYLREAFTPCLDDDIAVLTQVCVPLGPGGNLYVPSTRPVCGCVYALNGTQRSTADVCCRLRIYRITICLGVRQCMCTALVPANEPRMDRSRLLVIQLTCGC